LISSFWSSIVGIVFPLLAILTKKEFDTGLKSILSYRVFFPIFGVLSIVFILFTIEKIKERIIVEKEYQPKVKFWHGAKSLFSNKYFWIITIHTLLSGFRGMNIVAWINAYSLKSELAVSITTTLFGNALIPGMVLTGYLVKKVGKRSLMLVSGFLAVFTYIPMIIFPDQPILLLCLIFIQNLCSGFAACLRIMPADALEWQQLKTGERLEGFWGMFHMLILSIAGLGMGLITPWVLQISGMPAGTDVLENPLIRQAVFRNISIMSGIGTLLATIPFLFWDLTEERQKDIVEQLGRIAQEKNKSLSNSSD
jgi:Na+/melibiose symporter-like transporter